MLTRELFWQIPLTVLACVLGSLAAVWLASRALGFTMSASVVAMLSGVLSAAAIAIELRRSRVPRN